MITWNYVVVFLAVLLSGCVTVYPTFQPVPLSLTEQVYTPPINKQSQAALGDVLMVKVDGNPAKGFVAIQDYQPEDDTYSYGVFHYDPILRGSEWAIIGVLESGDYLCKNGGYQEPLFNGTRTKGNTALVVNADGVAYGFGSYTGRQVSVIRWKVPPAAPILRKADKVYLTGSFRQELIYNGKSSSTIKMSYREFKDDFARPAFTQELSYDLAESKTVGFRGMNIEVVEATNSHIKYTIKSPMR